MTEPIHTITTSPGHFGQVSVRAIKLTELLAAEELKLGQGFPKDYIIDRDYRWNVYPVSERVKRIGNSVVPVMAKALMTDK